MVHEEKPNAGEIIVNGYRLSTLRRKNIPKLRRTMGIVFQDFRLIKDMTVFDNVAFAMHVVGASTRDIRKRVAYTLNVVGLGDKARSYPDELSGGEQQRVGLARALVNNPSLIIADEPTGNVDPNMSYEIVELLTEINRRGTTVIMVTHEHQLVRDFGRRVIMIENGTVVADNYMPTPQTVPEAEVIAPISMSKEPVTDVVALSAEQERTLSCEPVPQAVPAAPNVAEYAAEETAFVGPTVASDEKAGDAQ